MKAIQLLVNSVLPDELKNYEADFSEKGLNKILYAVATKYPERFADVLQDISNIGRKVSYQQGETLTLHDLAPVIDRQAIYDNMEREIAALPRDKDFVNKRREIFQKYNTFIEKETSKNALDNRNNIAISVLSGARGKSAQLKAMISTPGTFSDYKGTPIDVFSKESFADGIRPVTFLASTYGARSSVISTKCLDYQSLVKMADLSEKKLCDIKVGDMVLGADKESKVFPVKVLNVFDQGEKECYKYTFRSSILEPESNEPICTVVCTKDHKFLNAKQGCPLPIKEAHKTKYMRPGVKWKLSDGSVAVATEAEPVGKVHCMDIEVDHPDHLFVLANGLITSNSSTAKGGDLAKQMAQSVVDMVIRTNDCGSTNGISLDIDDESLKGRVLANSVGGFKEGQFITRQMIHDLKKQGITNVIARSPLTCNTPNGLCAACVGKFYSGGKLPKIGDSLGAAASTALSEPVCLVKGTEVKMADGSVKKIEDIEPGEYVLGSDMNGYCKPVRVLNKFHNGPRDCYRSYIKKGYGKNSGHIILESTSAHKILGTIRSKTVPLHDARLNIAPIGIMPESKYTVRMCQSITGSEGGTVKEPMAMLLGMLVGDGSYKGTASGSAKHAVKLSCYDDEQVAVLRDELAPLNILVREYTAEHEYRIVEENPYNTQNWTAIDGITRSESTKVRNRVRAKLIQEGMWGQDCYTKTLPKTIWTWDNESIYKFVGGLIATDGYVTKNGTIGYSSNSIKLLQQIKELLQFRLGIYSSNIASSQKRKPDGTLYNPTYSFTISEASNVIRFAELIQIPGRKNAILLAANRKLNGKRRGLYKLEKQEYIGVQDTWDLEVDNDTHLFALANGLIVSNTQMALCIAGFEYVNRPDGSKIRIRNIEVGQEVCAADKHGHITSAKVLNVFDQGIKQVRTFTFESILANERPILHEDGTVSHTPAVRGQFTVTCTEDHKFLYTDGTIAPIKDIYESGKVLLMEDMRPATLISASEVFDEHCYDIEIDHPDHLFVLSSGFICSNSAKHTAGMTQSKKTYSGLGTITQFTQSPEKFKDKATVSELDGTVEDVHEAPQGGHYVVVSGTKHYVPAGHDVEVKPGDKVEAGDFLSEGLGDPEDIVRHKGLGAGRLYYANRLNQILADSGAKNDKRSTEILARGALRHVRIIDDTGYGQYLPDDIVDYNTLQNQYKMPETARLQNAKDSVGKYLQQPVLHYTIGTKITPKVVKDLTNNNLNEIYVDDNEPAFKPEMIRIRAASHTNPDWMASLGTSYLTKQLNESSTKGDDTNVLQNADYRPRLAFGKDFGKNIKQTGLF